MKNDVKVILARMYEYVKDAISICDEESNDYDKILANNKNQLYAKKTTKKN